MQESLSPEHGSELLRDPLEQLLDGCGIADEGGGHLQSSWRDVADSCLDVVRNPLNKVGAVLVLDVEHLLVHLLHGHPASEHGGDSQVTSMSRITGSHHVLGVEHLLSELRHSESSVLLRTSSSERSEARHEEVKTSEGDQVVEISIGGVGQLQGSKADIVESFVVNAVGLISVLHQLVHGESCIVGLDHGVRNLW